MKIKIGKRYVARTADARSELDHIQWVFEIVASVSRAGETYYVGLMAGGISNQTAQLFTENGETVETEDDLMGYKITGPSRAKAVWDVD